MMVRGGGDPRQAWLARRLREWACRLGALPPMRMTASWFGSAWNPPNTSVWRDVPRLMASSPRIIYYPIHASISILTAPRPPRARRRRLTAKPRVRPRLVCEKQCSGVSEAPGIASSVPTQTLPGAYPGGYTGTSRLCTTWTSRIVRALDQRVVAVTPLTAKAPYKPAPGWNRGNR